MKKTFLALLLLITVIKGLAQIKWVKDLSAIPNQGWNNYSTTFLGDLGDKEPLLVAAIPYNGTYSNMEEASTALDLSSENSLFRFKSTLSSKSRQLFTYDSGMVYFLTPGIFPENAHEYEYRILLNGKTEISPWSAINRFSDLTLNTFKKGFGFLGGYQTTWGNFISAEIRRKNTDSSIAITSIFWKQAKPVVSNIYTSKNLNDFFALLQRPWDNKTQEQLPTNFEFTSPENTIIFYLSAGLFKKEAMEYKLVMDNKVIRNWGPNDYDNNFIWLKELSPGKYKISIRYTRQRHNEAVYDFEIKPQWQQTTLFKIVAGSLLAAFVGFIILLFRARVQRRKLQRTEFEKEKVDFAMRSVRAKLNPHFIFNSLSSVQSLINQNEADKANEYLTIFSGILRQSLHYSDHTVIPIPEEIKMLTVYLQLEQLRFHFNYSVTADESSLTAELPVLLLQPLVENAVKHGVSAIQGEGIIDIHFYCKERALVVSITDNGKGFDKLSINKGYGLSLTQQRIELLNRVNKDQKIELSINSIVQGTKIIVIFNNWL